LDLQRQQFGLQQAMAGYVPTHTEYQPKPGTLAAPSIEQIMPGGAPSQINRAIPGQTVTDNLPGSSPVTVKGHYDPTKGIQYLTSMARVLEMQQRGVEAAKINAGARETVAGMNDDTRRDISNNVHGYIGTDGQVHYGMDYYNPVGISGFNNGQWVVDPTTGQRTFQNGVQTQGRIEAAQPGIQLRTNIANVQHADRQASLAERAQHDRKTEANAAARAAKSGPLPGIVTPPGFRPPTQSDLNKINSYVNGARFLNPTANVDSLIAAGTHQLNSVYAAQGADSLVNGGYTPGVTPAPSSGGSVSDRIATYIKNALSGPPKAASGAAPAPHVPTKGNDPIVLQQHSRAPQGGNAPTARLGPNHIVGDSSTATYPKNNHLPASPDAPTAPVAARRPLTAEEKAAAAKDPGFAQFLGTKGYTSKDWQDSTTTTRRTQ